MHDPVALWEYISVHAQPSILFVELVILAGLWALDQYRDQMMHHHMGAMSWLSERR